MNIWQRGRQVITLATVCLFLSTSPISAATPERPDAGSTLGGLQDRRALPPEKQAPGVEVGGEKKDAVPMPEGPKMRLGGVRITGQDIYGEDKLLPLVGDAFGKELSLSELESLAGRIAKYFQDQGYLVASAHIPAQDVKDGLVEIRVVVGRYGKIDIRNNSGLAQNTAAGLLANLKSGEYIRSNTLERALLLLNDTSGVSAKASLAPGEAPGTADLTVTVSDGAGMSGRLYVDNWGNRFTGQDRLGLNISINNPGGRGDTATIGGLYTGTGLYDYNLSYLLPAGGQGVKLGIGYSRLHYSLGEDFASLMANGLAKTTSVYATYPFARSRDHNLTGRLGYDHKQIQDRIDISGTDSRKKAGVWSLTLSGDSRDSFGGGGVTSFALVYVSGRLTLGSADAEINDLLPQTAGAYDKTSLSLYRTQYINDRLNLHLSFTGQLAGKNLDSSEKLSLGGASGVRAYPQGEAPGDEGYILTGELRWALPAPGLSLAAFYDSGHVVINKNPWPGAGENKRTLRGAGLGLIWSDAKHHYIRLDYAWRISADPAAADKDKHGRLWLQGVRYF